MQVRQRFVGMVKLMGDGTGLPTDAEWAAAEAALRVDWPDLVERSGGEALPDHPPTLERILNPGYGRQLTDERTGYPVLGPGGVPVVDLTAGMVLGRAVCLRNMPEVP